MADETTEEQADRIRNGMMARITEANAQVNAANGRNAAGQTPQEVAQAAMVSDPTNNMMQQTKQGNTTYFGVNTNIAKNPYLQGDLGQLAAQKAAIQGQTAAQTAAPGQYQAAQANTPSASLVAQAAGGNVNQQGFAGQAQNLAMLQQQAQGQGPAADAIRMQTQQTMNQGLNAQMALAGSSRGGNAGEIARQAAMGQAQVTGQAANQQAMNTLQSEQQGITNAGSVAGAMQGESLQQGQMQQQNQQFNAGAANTQGLQTQQLGEQTALANQQAQNQMLGQTQQLGAQTALANTQAQNQFQVQQDQMVQSLMDQGMTLEQAQQQANIQMAEYASGAAADQYAASQGHAISQQNADTSSASAAIAGLSTAANIAGSIGSAASDERVKKKKKSGDDDVSAFLKHLEAKTWDYKNPEKHGYGRHLGVMAQDLEKSKMGKGMVEEGDDGVKMVNYGGAKGMAAIVAALAHLDKKVKQLESLKGKH